ncbi:Gldg family protein [Hyphobacterium sp. CCMP332]|nr:Gldg family protein [Hyphobacterium sp. CCMP332]
MKDSRIILSVVLIVGILVVINFISDQLYYRLDLTEDKRYTLSEATKDILKDIEEPVTVKAFFSENLPPDIAKTRRDLQEMLVEYSSLSDGMLVFEFINPSENEELENQAIKAGIQPVMINVREKDQVKQQKAYLGVLIEMGEEKEIIPFMQPGLAMEYSLSTSIKKLSVIDKPVIGLVSGHGEASIAELQQLNAQLSILYQLKEVDISTDSDLSTYKTLTLIRPKDTIPAGELAILDAFLAQGGNLVIALNRVEADMQQSFGKIMSTGLESWLSQKGLNIPSSFLVDPNSGAVSVQQQQGIFVYNTQIQFPYLPIAQNFRDHPVTKGLEQVIFPFASPLNYEGDSSIKWTPLVYSSDKSGTQTAPTYFNIQKQWTEADYPLGKQVIGALLEGKISGTANSRLIVFGDGDFAVTGEGQGAQRMQADNISLMANSIDFLSDDTGLIELRTKGVTSRPLVDLEDGTKTTLKFLNFLLPIILVVIYGIARMQVKRNVRIKRMEENYGN